MKILCVYRKATAFT